MKKLSDAPCDTNLRHTGEKMARHPDLHRRGRAWYFRKRVPSDCVAEWGKHFVMKSLFTSDYREAVKRVHEEQVYFDRDVDAARARIAAQANGGSASVGTPLKLSPVQIERYVAEWLESERDRWQAMDHHALSEPVDGLSPLDELAREEQQLRSESEGNQAGIERTIAEILALAGYPMRMKIGPIQLSAAPGIPAFEIDQATRRALYKAARQARLDVTHAARRLFDHGEFELTISRSAAAPTGGYSLAELINDFANDPGRHSRSDKTDQDYAMVFRLLREIMGPDRQISSITRDDCKAARTVLSTLPTNATKKYPKLTLAEAAQKTSDTAPRLKPTTVNSHLTKIGAMFKWAVKEEKLDKSPARGLLLRDEPRSDEESRRPFTIAELQRLFSAPLYTGCVDDERNYSKPGPNRPRRARFWAPLIAVFCGLRQNEICQLATSDVEEIDGIAVIQVRTGHRWQQLKTPSARRSVPVHPELVRIGFLAYVAQMRSEGHPQLFPELRPDGRGYMSGIFQKRFHTFRKSVGISDPYGVFHSFRHGWRDALRRANVSEEKAQQLGGWKGEGVDKGYGSGFTPSALHEEIQRISYPGLDLSHLHLAEGA